MAIDSGTKLGPYEILAPLGAGGMGEVYRAKDTRLDRTVAIKVLPPHLSGDPDLRQRFEREARAVSSLNHPHICTLHDIGHQEGTDFLVMEYIEGDTLSVRLQKGPLAIADLLRYSIQIADALDKAHKKGIIHRDLKPGNIILAKTGAKVLDFGLAKVAEQKPASGVSQLATEHRELTREGTILGTLQYMAPEQLEGKETDARSDIFSFGAVMYEMATGKKAFEGSSQASLIAAILKEEPKPLSQFQPLSPPILERLVKTCLAKDPEDRWQSAHDITNELRWIAESSSSQSVAHAGSEPAKAGYKSGRTGWIVAGILGLALVAGLLWTGLRWKSKEAQGNSQIHFVIPPSRREMGAASGVPHFAVSRDGRQLVYQVIDSSGKDQLWLRSFESFNAKPIPGTENSDIPFWSPDDRQIAFHSKGVLKKLALGGGTLQEICKVNNGFHGGAWLQDGTIVFSSGGSGLQRVSSNGGQPQPLTTLNPDRQELVHTFPVFLPDGRHFLYSADSNKAEERAVYLGSLDSKDAVRIVDSRYKVNYLEPGYLLYVRGNNTLVAQRLELDPPRLVGEVVQIADDMTGNAAVTNSPFTASSSGTIVYRGGDSWAKTQLAWFDRNGKSLGTVGSVESNISVTLSPDGERAAVSSTTGPNFRSGTGEESVNIWVIDLERGIRSRVTVDPSVSDENPTWSPDGRFLAFASHRKADRAEVFKIGSAGGKEQLFYSGTGNEHPVDWSPDGKFLLLFGNGNLTDLFSLSLSEGDLKLTTFVSTATNDMQGQFSPDGRLVAYTSAESGRNEVYVTPFPEGDGKWQISSTGGSEPRWRGDGKELFYLSPDGTLMAVSVSAGSPFQASTPVTLFKTGILPIDLGSWGAAAQYDVSKDGSRFLINTIVVPPTPSSIFVIVNWKPPAPGVKN